MGFSRVFIAFALLTCVMSFFLGELCHAQDLAREFLAAHNRARAQVGVRAMTWDKTVASYARNYANRHIRDCRLVHSQGPYGENLAMSTGDLSAASAVAMWVNEKSLYDYNSNKCIGKDPMGCLHYTQVVWRDSTRLGCAKVRCSSGGTFITCNYDPPGNWIGQRPYGELELATSI